MIVLVGTISIVVGTTIRSFSIIVSSIAADVVFYINSAIGNIMDAIAFKNGWFCSEWVGTLKCRYEGRMVRNGVHFQMVAAVVLVAVAIPMTNFEIRALVSVFYLVQYLWNSNTAVQRVMNDGNQRFNKYWTERSSTYSYPPII